jgi:hypothetical protein
MSASPQNSIYSLLVVFTIAISTIIAALLALLHHKVTQIHYQLARLERLERPPLTLTPCPPYEDPIEIHT